MSAFRIINMSSVLGLIPAPYSALYSSTKHALEGYSESLDHELRAFGIRVVLVEPAYTRTSFEDNLTTPDRLLDVYDLARAGGKAIVREAMQTGDGPEVVAETVVKAATAAVPAMRRERWRAKSVICAVSRPKRRSTKVCAGRCGCRHNSSRQETRRRVFLFVHPDGSQLAEIGELLKVGRIRPAIDKIFPFKSTKEALAYVEKGRAKGKVVVKVR